MKLPGKTLKIVSLVVAGVLALGLLAILGVFVKFYLLSPDARPPLAVAAPTSADAVARGDYLANHVAGCMRCHSPVDEANPAEPILPGQLGTGRDFGEDRAVFPGHVRSPNLTPDPETGLGRWSDGEIVRAIREGVSREGRALFPMMPYQRYATVLSDDDALAIVAYLRHLPPVRHDAGIVTLDFPLSMLVRTSPRALKGSSPPPPVDGVPHGEWLLQIANCVDCHTPTNDDHEPIPGQFLAGGMPYPVPGKGMVFAANITSDKATGIGAYTDEDILRALTEGVGKDGRRLYGMPWSDFSGMTDADKRSIVAALRAVPPVHNIVPSAQPDTRQSDSR